MVAAGAGAEALRADAAVAPGFFPDLGADPANLSLELIMPWLLQGPLFNALDVTCALVRRAPRPPCRPTGRPRDPGPQAHVRSVK